MKTLEALIENYVKENEYKAGPFKKLIAAACKFIIPHAKIEAYREVHSWLVYTGVRADFVAEFECKFLPEEEKK